MKRNTASILTLFTVSVVLSASESLSGETITVDFSVRGDHAGIIASGFHGGWSDVLPDSLLYPLKPSMVRGLNTDPDLPGMPQDNLWIRAHELNAVVIVGFPVWGLFESACGGGSPCDSIKLAAWSDSVKAWVERAKSLRVFGLDTVTVHYDIWNEPDALGAWNSDQVENSLGVSNGAAFFYEVWKTAVDTIRVYDPLVTGEPDAKARITGPSFSGAVTGLPDSDPNASGVNMHDFLTYCDGNDCYPDVLGWHTFNEVQDDNGDIVKQVQAARESLLAHGQDLDSFDFEINEMMHCEQGLRPGVIIRNFARAEEARENGLLFAGRAYWCEPLEVDEYCDSGCEGSKSAGKLANIIDSALADSTHFLEKRYGWWVYKAYADMVGDWVRVDSTSALDGLAARDDAGKAGRVLLGSYVDTPRDTLVVRLKGLHDIDGLVVNEVVEALVQRIPGTDSLRLNPGVEPANVSTDRELVFGDSLDITIPDFGEYDAITIELTPIIPDTVIAPG